MFQLFLRVWIFLVLQFLVELFDCFFQITFIKVKVILVISLFSLFKFIINIIFCLSVLIPIFSIRR